MPEMPWLLNAEKSVASKCRKRNGSFMPKDDTTNGGGQERDVPAPGFQRRMGHPGMRLRHRPGRLGATAPVCLPMLAQDPVKTRFAGQVKPLVGQTWHDL